MWLRGDPIEGHPCLRHSSDFFWCERWKTWKADYQFDRVEALKEDIHTALGIPFSVVVLDRCFPRCTFSSRCCWCATTNTAVELLLPFTASFAVAIYGDRSMGTIDIRVLMTTSVRFWQIT